MTRMVQQVAKDTTNNDVDDDTAFQLMMTWTWLIKIGCMV